MSVTPVFKMAALCLKYISAMGYELTDQTMTPELAEEIEAMEGRSPISSILSPFKNDFTSQNSFWLILRKDNTIVGTLGARLDDASDGDIRDHLTRLHNRHFASDGRSAVLSKLPNSASAITGGLVYMGDVFFAPEHRGDVAKTQCFCQYAFCLAFARWWERAEWLVALHRQKDVLAGKVAQYGFTSVNFPAAQNWVSPPNGRSDTEYLSALSKEHFLRNIDHFIQHPDSLVAPPVHRQRPRA
jgi:hypothetical protein